MQATRAIVLLACAWAASCSHLSQQQQQRQALMQAATPYHGQVLELRHSSVFGDMYDDDEHWLVTAYPFDEIYHRVDLFDRPIHPQHMLGRLPAGTRVRIEGIELPGRVAWLKRMPSGPIDHVWVRVRPLSTEPLNIPGPERPMYLVLARPLQTPVELEHAIGQVLAPIGEVSSWLASLRPTQQVAIAHKEVIQGMSEKELVAAAGEPWRWLEDHDLAGRRAKVAWYPRQEVWLAEDAVVDMRTARQLH